MPGPARRARWTPPPWPRRRAAGAGRLLVQPAAPTALRLAGHMLFIAVAAALFLHLMPGFHNPLVIPRAPLSPDAVPFSMYLNLDKPLVAFWIILALPPVMTGLDAGRTLRATLACGAAAVLVCLTLALALGMVGWAPSGRTTAGCGWSTMPCW